MSFVEGISAAGVDVADPTFAICITALVLLVAGIFALPALAAALSLLRAASVRTRVLSDLHAERALAP